MLTFTEKIFKCSTMRAESSLPSLSYEKEKVKAKSTISDFEGLFIGYGTRETAYPYKEQNLYEDEKEQKLPVAILENEFLYAEFLPTLGGRLWKLYDKKKQKDILYTNDVIRFRNLSIRNAWFSGGVEWNCGVIGHTPFTCSQMYTAKVKGKNGEDVLRFYEFERTRSIYYQMDFWLEKNVLMSCVRIENPNEEVVPMYWWSNMATPEYKCGRVVVPASSAYNNSDGMGIKKSSIPFDNGMDVSYPENIPNTIDYFYDIDQKDNKFIANVDVNGFGLLQFSSHNLKGRKLFSWGHIEGSANWQDMLTEKAGWYVEIQAGLGKTQYECLPMPPKTTWSFMECYTLADIGSEAVQKSYDSLVDAVNEQVNTLYSSDKLDELYKYKAEEISLQKGEIVFSGSGFGYLHNLLENNAPKHLAFTAEDDAKAWIDFAENGSFSQIANSFAYGNAMKNLLEKSENETDWQIPYQLALIEYDERNYDKAKLLCEKSLILDNNYLNNHLYASVLYQLNQSYSYFAIKTIQQKTDDYSVCESVFRLLLKGECYNEIIDLFERLSDNLKASPRLNMYLSMAYLKAGDVDKAEQVLMQNGGLRLLDFREGDKFLDMLYKGIRKEKYGEKEDEIIVPKQFDFIVFKPYKEK
ncbi:MAG: DUF5107 domain-containing protein [Eubacterium sp.]|nr:DUF5107 domain-containing protein [Eubacterium sp.]